ncbi:MAG: signal peptidase I [Clostridia bacterium]|nr:signal peptidase I [Clostridia bacterium]
MEQEQKQMKALRKRAISVYDVVSTLVVSLLVLVVVFTFFVRVVRVDGDSMNTTLRNGDQVLLYTSGSEYRHGDIVVIDRYAVVPLVKRIIAVGGDTLKIGDDGMVYLNGSMLSEPYARGMTKPKDCTETIIIPDGYVFVMGDNRMDSHDSRSSDIGLISVKDIVGKAVYRVAPFSAFGDIYTNLEHSAV